MRPLRMLRWLQTFPISSANTEISCSCNHGSCIPFFFNSGDEAASFLELLESEYFFLIIFGLVVILQQQLFACLRRILLSTRLRMSDFWIWVEEHQLLGCSYDFFSFHRHTPDWLEIPNFVKRFPHSFDHDRATPDMAFLSPLDNFHSKSSSDLVLTWRSAFWPDRQKENHCNGYKHTVRNSSWWTN